jgi:protein-tyrosine phosphatase
MALRDWNEVVTSRYGGKRPWLRSQVLRLVWALGGFRRFSAVDWHAVSRLVFVCNGNICRSPYCEARARALGFSAWSFGFEAGEDKPVHPTALEIGMNRGVDLSRHRTRTPNEFAPQRGDLLIGMEPGHAKSLERLYRSRSVQITLLGLWQDPPTLHIQDPLDRGYGYFTTCYSLLDRAIEGIADRIKLSYGPLDGR